MTTLAQKLATWASRPFVVGWLAPVAVFALARVVSAVMMVQLASESHPEAPFTSDERKRGLGTDPLSMTTYWDGRWYEEIATHGYPDVLPKEDGEAVQNAWAFYPLFPSLAAALMRLGLSFEVAALVLSLALGAAAMVVLHRMLLPQAGAFTALLTVAGLSWAPTSPVFQVAYTEGLALLLVLATLWALRERRYLVGAGLALTLSVSRPVVPALAVVIGILWLLRWRRRRTEAFPRSEMLQHAALAGFTACTFAIWPLACGLLTGELDAYAQTQMAWRNDAWGWRTWLTSAFVVRDPGAIIVVLPIVVGALWLAVRRGSRAWGDDLRAWVGTYPVYILAVSQTTPSIFRYLMLTALPAWPLPDLSARLRSTRARVALLLTVVTIGATLQYWWLKVFFTSFKIYP